jgi:hypothetical protein
VSIIHLNRKELKLLKALDREYPGGVERTKELFQDAMTLEELGFAESSATGFMQSGLRITEAGKQFLRERNANQFSWLMKIAGGIVTLLLIPVLVNLISDYVLPVLFK